MNTKGRVDILVLRLAEEFGERIRAQTTIDVRDVLKQTAEQLIEDMEIPATPITANTVVRSLLGLPDRAATPGPRKTKPSRLRRVV
jgi:hypothetical protein